MNECAIYMYTGMWRETTDQSYFTTIVYVYVMILFQRGRSSYYIYNSSYTKKVWSILYAYSYLCTYYVYYVATYYIKFAVSAIVLEKDTIQLLKVSL